MANLFHTLHKIFALVAVIATMQFGAFSSVSLAADDSAQALSQEKIQARRTLARDMANSVLSIISDPAKAAKERESALELGFANVVDIDWIAKFVLGQAWRNATPEQKQRYTELYRTYLTKIYVANYATSSERKISAIKVIGVKDNNASDFTAYTEIMLTDNDRLKVDYLVSERDKGYKIIDVIIEGVSLLNTHRAEFSQLAAKNGVTGVISKLEHLVGGKSPITLSMK